MFEYYDVLLTPEQAAEQLGVGMNTIYTLLKQQKIRAMKVGRHWKVPKRAVQQYILQETQMKAAGW